MKKVLLFSTLLFSTLMFSQKKSKKKLSNKPKVSNLYNQNKESVLSELEPFPDYKVVSHHTGDFNCSNISPKYEQNETSLTITNGGDLDMVLKIVNVDTEETIRVLYIRSKDRVITTNIPQGKYYFKEAHGRKWKQKITDDGKCIGIFTEDAVYNRGKNIADFNITKSIVGNYEQINIPTYELELGMKVYMSTQKRESNYKKSEISAEEFNK